jgi:hypothetical protein
MNYEEERRDGRDHRIGVAYLRADGSQDMPGNYVPADEAATDESQHIAFVYLQWLLWKKDEL